MKPGEVSKKELYPIYRNNPKGLEEYFGGLGYRMLGWQVHAGNNADLKACYEAGHMGHQGEDKRKVYDIQHNARGSDVTYWCEECKNVWKIDMSD